jgi:UDP-N-acetylmuramate dehydrogenase
VREHHDIPLAELTTLGVGGPARRLVSAETSDEVVAAMGEADRGGSPVLVLAGGSNLVLTDAGLDGTVVRIATTGGSVERSAGSALVSVAAGEPWDAVVARCVADGLAGIECLSGIPGSTGATPIQNVGAYGQEVAETIVAVRAWDRREGQRVELGPDECGFGYRTSAFKGAERYVVLEVVFELEPAAVGRPIRYPELARALGVEVGARAPLGEVRKAVLTLRRSKGMVIDPDDPDSVSAGSFFTNPVLDAARFELFERRVAELLGADARPPSWPSADGGVKTSAAWLIERAGFGRGYGEGAVGISSKHTLALVNRGGASTAELLELAREIRAGVEASFGIRLEPEPTLVGVEL